MNKLVLSRLGNSTVLGKQRWLFAAALVLLVASPIAGQSPFAEEIQVFGVEDEVNPAPDCATLFVGSSSFRFWFRMQQDFGKRHVIKRGFGGAKIADINHYFERVVGRYRPDRIVFYAGENDLNGGKSPVDVVKDFESFLARKTAAMGETPVYFISIKPSVARIPDFAAQTDLNRRIAHLAGEREDLVYIDVVAPMLKDGKPRPELFISDKLHMNRKGYDIWREQIKRSLRSGTASKSPNCS